MYGLYIDPFHPDPFPHQVSLVQIVLLILLNQSAKPTPDQVDKRKGKFTTALPIH